MPKNNETTTTFKVDISELKKAMQEAKRQISIANSEFKEASSGMDDWSKSTDGITAKLKQLDSNLKSQKTILSNLEKQYAAVVSEQGEGSAAADRLKVAINNQKATINKTEKDIRNYEDSLKEVGEAEKIAAKTGKDVTEVLDELGNEAKDTGDGFTTLKGTIATFAGNMLSSFVGAVKDGISNIIGLAEETREYRTELGKLETAFTTAGFTTEAATKTYKDLYAVLGDEGQSVEAANMLAKLCDTEEELADWTTIATGVYGTFGSSLPIESLTEAANETSKTGQITGALADALNWAGVSEDDFQTSLDGCSSEQERQALITNTLNGLYSDAAKKYEETNKGVMDANRANSDYTDTLATMGAKIEPVTTAVKEGFNGLLQKALELIEGVDMGAFTEKIKEGFSVLTNDVLPAIKTGFQWIIDNKDILISGLAGIAAGFVAFKVASLITTVTKAMKGMSAATALAAAKQWLLNTALLANPIALVVALIVGIVAAIVMFVSKNETARKKLKEVWTAIKTFIGNSVKAIAKFFTDTIPKALDLMVEFFKKLPGKIWTWLVNTVSKVTAWAANMKSKAQQTGINFINTIVDFFSQLPGKIWTWLINVVSRVTSWSSNMTLKAGSAALNFVNTVVDFIRTLPGKVWTWLINVVSKVGTWGVNLARKGKEAASDLVTAVIDKAKEIPDKILSVGADIVSGLWNGINDKVSWLKDKISGFVGDVTSWLKDFFKIGSPSKLMADEIGQWLPEGIAVGIDKKAKSVISSIRDMSADAVGAAKDGLTSSTFGASNSGVVNNYYQTINSPKPLNRLEIYRQSKNLLIYAGGR